MSDEKRITSRLKPLALDLLRACLAYFAFITIAALLSGAFILAGSEIVRELDLPDQLVYLVSCLPLPFSAYSVTRAFELYDKEAQVAFDPDSVTRYRVKEAFKMLFSRGALLRKLVVHALSWVSLALLLPPRLGFTSVLGAIDPTLTLTAGKSRLILAATVVPSLLLLTLLAKTSAHKWWVIARTAEREKILNHPHPRVRIFLEILKIFGIYLAAFCVLPTVIMIAVSFILVLPLFRSSGLWITIGVAIALVLLSRTLSVLFSRIFFWKKAVSTLSSEGYALTDVRLPILSAIFPADGATAKIEKDGCRYTVKLLSPRHARAVYVTEDGRAIMRHSFSFLFINLFHILGEESFATEGDECCIVVFSPEPKRLFAHFGNTDGVPDDGDGGIEFARNRTGSRGRFGPGYKSDLSLGIIRPMASGDKLGRYKFYTPSAFLSAVDNNCLHR